MGGSPFSCGHVRGAGDWISSPHAGKLTQRMPPDSPATARHTLLVVDDEPLYLRSLLRFLRDPAFEILSAEGGDEALSLAAAHPGAVDLLLTDVVLPGTDGPALAARLRERHPAMRVLFMSGYGVEILAKYGATAGDDAFLTKPIAPEVLRDCVTRLLGTR